MDSRPIGVFDSGVGGLTTLRELSRILPGEDILYFGDTGRVPYGTRGEDTIVRYAMEIIQFLTRRSVKMIVAACGTVSATLPETVARSLSVPFTGVVEPTAKAAAGQSASGRIAVLGTPATIRSGAFERAIRALRPEAEVTGQACALFVPLAESGLIEADNPIARLTAEMYLTPLLNQGIDTAILGCTHYPLMAPVIGHVLGEQVQLIDAGATTARHVKNILAALDLLASPGRQGRCDFFVTDAIERFVDIAHIFLGRPITGSVTRVPIEALLLEGPSYTTQEPLQ